MALFYANEALTSQWKDSVGYLYGQTGFHWIPVYNTGFM
jgi:hypothetical protein